MYRKLENCFINSDFFRVWRNKFGELWSSNKKVGHVHFDPPKINFFRRPYFGP